MKLKMEPWYYSYMRKVVTEEFDHAALGAECRRRRIAEKISLRELARQMGVSAVYVSDLERGRRPWSVERVKVYDFALAACESRHQLKSIVDVMKRKNSNPSSDFLIGKAST